MNGIDELLQVIRHSALAQVGATRTHLWGYVASYDPSTHMVKVILSSVRDENGTPVTTPWIQLGTMWAGRDPGGNFFGFQAAPYGGATEAFPEQGEQCLVELSEQQGGASVAAFLLYTDVQQPPVKDLRPGEAVLVHGSGATLRFLTSGRVLVSAAPGEQVMLGGDGLTELDGLVHGSSTDPSTGMTYAFLGSTTKDHLRGKK